MLKASLKSGRAQPRRWLPWLCLLVCAPSSALADVSGWAFVGAGPSRLDGGQRPGDLAGLQFDAGMGSSPEGWLVLGGLGRLVTHLDRGAEISLLGRLSTQGFSQGDWGLALDVGGFQRLYGEGELGPAAALNLGGPWGTQLGLSVHYGEAEQSYLLSFGFDWARLTSGRRSGQQWWPQYYLPVSAESSVAP